MGRFKRRIKSWIERWIESRVQSRGNSRVQGRINCSYNNARIERIWRNVYTEENYQDPHIHPHCQWSFIIYETVDESKTIFFNPAFKEIQNQINHSGIPEFPIDYRPKLKSGSIIIFPSF